MTSAQLGSLVTLVTASAVVIILVLFGTPRLARLLFRHRLESIRDDCVDAILDDRLRREPPVDSFLGLVDYAAEHARWLTLPRALAMYAAYAGLGVDVTELAAIPSYCELEPAERKIMHDLDSRCQAAFWSYMTWGSPFGWVIGLLTLIARRVHPGSKFAKTENALPTITREAMCSERSAYPAAAQWASGSRHLFAGR